MSVHCVENHMIVTGKEDLTMELGPAAVAGGPATDPGHMP